MLNVLSDLQAAVQTRTSFGEGICLHSAVARTVQPRKGSVVFARPRARSVVFAPRAHRAADVFGQLRLGAGLAVRPGQPNSRKQYSHMTRIVAASGGAKGPHPAREPV